MGINIKACFSKKKEGCDWVGEMVRVDDHLKECEISCNKCKQFICFSTVKSHLDTECPYYCLYCDVTTEREVISSEHKEKCHKFPITCPNNMQVNDVPQNEFDKTNKINELQSTNQRALAETQKSICIATTEKEIQCSERFDKPNDFFSKQSYVKIFSLLL